MEFDWIWVGVGSTCGAVGLNLLTGLLTKRAEGAISEGSSFVRRALEARNLKRLVLLKKLFEDDKRRELYFRAKWSDALAVLPLFLSNVAMTTVLFILRFTDGFENVQSDTFGISVQTFMALWSYAFLALSCVFALVLSQSIMWLSGLSNALLEYDGTKVNEVIGRLSSITSSATSTNPPG
jgi:hypothetical protein